MGAHPIGMSRQWPCVGSPEDEMYSCGAEGSVSLLAGVAGSQVADGLSDEPILLHVTACPRHLRAVRAWLVELTPFPEDITAWSTAALMEHWDMVERGMEDTPIYSYQRAS